MKYNRRIQKWHKKGISLLLILLICISTCSGFAFAEDGVEDKTILTYAEQDGKVAIETFRPTASCTEQWQLSVQSFAEWAIENGYSSAEEAFEVNDMVYVSGEANQDIPASVGAGEDLKATPDGLSLYQGDGGSHYLWRLCKAEQANDEESAEESIWDYFWVRTAQPVAMQEYPKESEQSENTIEETYHVIYDANYPDEATKTAGEVPVDETEYTKGADAEVAGNTGNLTAKRSDKEVYQFLGWTTEQNATEPEYTGTALDEKKLTVNSGADITLFAVWKLVKASDRATGNVCQIIRGAAYDEATGTFSGGTYVDGYPTLQEAVSALEGTGDEVIEMIADYEMPDTDVVTVADKKFYLTTAPKADHTAGENGSGDGPKLYTGSETVATIKRGGTKTSSVITINGSTECTISNLTIDGNKVTSLEALLKVSGSSILNLNAGTTLQNAISRTGTQSLHAKGGAIYIEGGTLNVSKGTEIKNNSSNAGAGIYVGGGSVYVSGGIISGNKTTQQGSNGASDAGGGIFINKGELYLSGGEITNNSSGKGKGSGILVAGGTVPTTAEVYVSGNPIVKDNLYGGYEQDNLHLTESNKIYVNAPILAEADIGVTVEGAMNEFSLFAYLTSEFPAVAAETKLLQRLRNDKDADLYGADAGNVYGRAIVWARKTYVTEYEYVCKIKEQGYCSITDAFADIQKNIDDSQTPTQGNAIPDGDTYKVEMLQEEYTLPFGVTAPIGKKIILTTAAEPVDAEEGALDYHGTKGTYAAIKRSGVFAKVPMLAIPIGGNVTFQNIIFDGRGGAEWKDIATETEVTGTGNLSVSSPMVRVSGVAILDSGSVFRNHRGSTAALGVDRAGNTNTGEYSLIIKDGSLFQGLCSNERSNGMAISVEGDIRARAKCRMEGGTIRDAYAEHDDLASIIVLSFSDFEMSGGKITENTADGIEVGTTANFLMSGGSISNNNGHMLSPGILQLDGNVEMSGGEITGNKAGMVEIGGAVYMMGGYDNSYTFKMTGGRIVGNVAENAAGGIYNEGRRLEIAGTAQVYGNASGTGALPSSTGEADLGKSGVRDNVYLVANSYINVAGKLEETAKIGITAEGKDETLTDRMTTGARFGVNGDNTQEVLDSLDHFFRDTNGTAADGIRLYGADGGMLDEGNPEEDVAPTYKVVWEPKQFTLTFDANGGDGTMKEILHDGETPLNLEGNTFTYPGHKFLGWNTKADGSGEDVEDKKQGYEPGMKDITLYAQWESTNNALTVSNVVVDAPEGFSEDFDYKLTVKVPTDSESPTSIDCINSGNLGTTSITLDANGEGKFSLKPGANIILQIPRDATYIIEQTKKNEYQTVNAVNGGTQSNSLTTGEISMDRADSRVVFTNTKLYTLTLHKAMTGDFIDSTREFAFDVTITYADNTTKTEKLTLKKDGSVLLTSPLLRGTKVTITEAAASGYSTSYVVNGDDAKKTQGRILDNLLIDGDKDVVCTNHSEIAITGVDTGSSNHLPIIIAGAFLILLLMSGTILRFRYLRKKGEDING